MQELQTYAFAVAAQAARGTPATVTQKRLVHVAGDLKLTKDEGSEPFSDLSKFGDATDWLNSITGAGTPGSEMTSDELAYLLWLYHGAEAVAAPVNAVQSWVLTGAPTGGNVVERFRGEDITIPWNTTAAALQALLEATAYLAPGDVTCAGGPWPAAITVTFAAAAGGKPQPLPTLVTNGLTGGAAPTVVPTHTTPGTKRRFRFVGSSLTFLYSTWWKRVGRTIVDRHVFADVRIGQMVLEASTANKAGRMTPSLFSLDPGIYKTADPTWPAIPAKAPLLFTEGRAGYTLDGIVHRGQSQLALTLNEDLSPAYADDTVAQDLVSGTPAATLAATVLLDTQGQALWNRQIYGVDTPSPDAKPSRDVSQLGSYAASLKQRDQRGDETGDRLDLTVPGIKWQPPEKPDPNPAGGNAELAVAGSMRPIAGQEPYTIDVYCDEAAAHVVGA